MSVEGRTSITIATPGDLWIDGRHTVRLSNGANQTLGLRILTIY